MLPDIVVKLVLKLSNEVVTVGMLADIIDNDVDICANATVIVTRPDAD